MFGYRVPLALTRSCLRGTRQSWVPATCMMWRWSRRYRRAVKSVFVTADLTTQRGAMDA
jgi:hypothetical protein